MAQTAVKEYRFNIDVHIFDTDCFGVMWHGAYVKWLEMGRVNFFKSLGVEMSKPEDESGYIYPVVDQHFRFKAPARMGDVLTMTTRVRVDGYKFIFEQRCENLNTGKTTFEAETTCVLLDFDWKLQRKIPDDILNKLEGAAV